MRREVVTLIAAGSRLNCGLIRLAEIQSQSAIDQARLSHRRLNQILLSGLMISGLQPLGVAQKQKKGLLHFAYEAQIHHCDLFIRKFKRHWVDRHQIRDCRQHVILPVVKTFWTDCRVI